MYKSDDPRLDWLKEVPDIITGEKVKELHREFSTPYIIYRRRRWGVEYYCTHCMKYHTARYDQPINTPVDESDAHFASTIRSGSMITCPHCGERMGAKSAGRSRRKMYECHNITVYKASADGETLWGICGQLFPNIRRLNPEEPKDINIKPKFETIYIFRLCRGSADMCVYNYYRKSFVFCNTPKEPYVGWFFNVEHFNIHNGIDEINKSFLRYVSDSVFKRGSGIWKPIAMLQFCAVYPQMERLLKSGLSSVAVDIANGLPYKRTINLNGQKPADMLRVDSNTAADIIKYCDDDYDALDKIKFYKYIRKFDSKIKFSSAYSIYKKFIYPSYFTYGRRGRNKGDNIEEYLALTGMTPTQLNNYIERQYEKAKIGTACCHAAYTMMPTLSTVCKHYMDYIQQCVKLGYDLSDSIINRPKDLEAAHNRASEAIRAIEAEEAAKKDMEAQKKYAERYKVLCDRFAYVGAEYIIVVPEKPSDIVNEGKNQRNCVGGYANRHIDGATTILFMRRAEAPTESYVTLEIKEDRYGKAYFAQAEGSNTNGNYRKLPEGAKEFLDKWLDGVNQRKNKKSKTA